VTTGGKDVLAEFALPPHYQAILVHQQTEFPADNPAMVGQAFVANLLGTVAFADRVNALDPVRVVAYLHAAGNSPGLVASL
jgi:hypothetical protein